MSHSGWVHLDVEVVVKKTDKAMLLMIDGESTWFPLSQISEPDRYDEGDENCSISVSSWIAKQKGLSDE